MCSLFLHVFIYGQAYAAEMKTRYQWLISVGKLFFLFFTSFFVHTISVTAPGCELNFTTFPYQPTGECIGHQKKINYWDSFGTTLCCRDPLTELSLALARQAKLSNQGNNNSIFIDQNQWVNCTNSFLQQPSVWELSCGFDQLFYGSSQCSTLNLSAISQLQIYGEALGNCSQFNSSAFSQSCKNCSASILLLRDKLLTILQINKNNTEKAICVMAGVTSVAAGILGDPNPSSVDDFYSCLEVLEALDPGFIKIKTSTAQALLAFFIAITGMMFVVILIKCVTRNQKNYSKSFQTKQIKTWSSLYRFSKAEIENALNFSSEKVFLGQGSAGQVYKGILPSGQEVAIKQIYRSNTSDSFTREVENLSKVRHQNLVCLFGCCVEDGEQYLVYEFCPNGNLAQHLLRKDTVLTWGRRVKILRDCALALRYLHHYIDGCIVHRDIKLTNILLSENLDPKLSDFGLARMLSMEESKVFTDVRGTIGYMDPEYMSNAKLTCASDIYSFGIVALQLLSGQKVIELDLDARDQLTRKAKDVSIGKRPLTEFEDPRLNGSTNSVDFESLLQIAVLCVAKSSRGRPTIDVVFEEMDKAWKNIQLSLRAKNEKKLSGTPGSRSSELNPV
ncbi:unnamed protein product [Camellia sinensis]